MTQIHLLASGKWILAGEHSVLRGCDALVFPLKSRKVELGGWAEVCDKSSGSLHFTAKGELETELPSLFMGVLNRAFDLLADKNLRIRGELHIKNALPFGAGLGASASVCVLITNLLYHLKLLTQDQRFLFARQLENIFHGESSGVDIAVTMVDKPIRFNREKGFEILEFDYRPTVTLHYTGKQGVTRECIDVVKGVFKRDPELGYSLDLKMQSVVEQCEVALKEADLVLLRNAMNLACEVYHSWGLMDPMSERLKEELLSQGAIAVKPTGSGLGGYLLALWHPSSQGFRDFSYLPAFSGMG